jgi:hypothetical protein
MFLAGQTDTRMVSLLLRIDPMAASKPFTKPHRRVAVLVDTSTSWGRRIIEGVHRYESEHSRWQLFVEPRGVDQRRWLPAGWQGDGVIARVGFPELSEQLGGLGLITITSLVILGHGGRLSVRTEAVTKRMASSLQGVDPWRMVVRVSIGACWPRSISDCIDFRRRSFSTRRLGSAL